MVKNKVKQNLFNINYNKSSEACNPCATECEKIDKKINNRKLSEIKDDEVAHILNVFEIKR